MKLSKNKNMLLVKIAFSVFLMMFLVTGCNSDLVGDSVSLAEQCKEGEGIWVEEANECEGISEEKCSELGGSFEPCASACRNDPEADICTMQCVQVCSFDNN